MLQAEISIKQEAQTNWQKDVQMHKKQNLLGMAGLKAWRGSAKEKEGNGRNVTRNVNKN